MNNRGEFNGIMSIMEESPIAEAEESPVQESVEGPTGTELGLYPEAEADASNPELGEPGQPSDVDKLKSARAAYEAEVEKLPTNKYDVPAKPEMVLRIQRRGVTAGIYPLPALFIGVGKAEVKYKKLLEKLWNDVNGTKLHDIGFYDVGSVDSEILSKTASTIVAQTSNADGSKSENHFFLYALCQVAAVMFDYEKLTLIVDVAIPKKPRAGYDLGEVLHAFVKDNSNALLAMAPYFGIVSTRERTALSNRKIKEAVFSRMAELQEGTAATGAEVAGTEAAIEAHLPDDDVKVAEAAPAA